MANGNRLKFSGSLAGVGLEADVAAPDVAVEPEVKSCHVVRSNAGAVNTDVVSDDRCEALTKVSEIFALNADVDNAWRSNSNANERTINAERRDCEVRWWWLANIGTSVP